MILLIFCQALWILILSLNLSSLDLAEELGVSKLTILKLAIRVILSFIIAVLDDSQHVGGLTVFGKSFGNYHQDIFIRIVYELQL